MAETVNEIEDHIDRTRERLGSTLRELEDKVEAVTDWREQFHQRPHLFLGAAFAGGVLLSAMVRPSPLTQTPPGWDTTPTIDLSDVRRAAPVPCRRRRWTSGTTCRAR